MNLLHLKILKSLIIHY